MENELADILKHPETLHQPLREFCNQYFALYFHFKPLFGGILVEVGGRLNMDLLLNDTDWETLSKALQELPEDSWSIRQSDVKGMMLLKVIFKEGMKKKEYQHPHSLQDLGLDEARQEALQQVLQLSQGVILVSGPPSQQKQQTIFALAYAACSEHYRRGGGWVEAKHFPHVDNLSWFNASGVDEFALDELKAMLRSHFDVVIWEAGHNDDVWQRLLQASRDEQLVIISCPGYSTIETLMKLRQRTLSEDLLSEVKAALTVLPMEYRKESDTDNQQVGSVFEFLQVDSRIHPTWLAGGSSEQMFEIAGEQSTFWTLYADGMRGVSQGLFDEDAVRRRLAWMTE